MTFFKYLGVSVTVLGIAVSGIGCGDNDEGTLQQKWTISGRTDVNDCTRFNASQMRLVIVDTALVVQATRFVPCGDFGAQVSLEEGDYTGTATFLEPNGTPASEVRAIAPFRIFDDVTTTVNVDFPLEAFINR